jgi:hypothetical protein
MSGFVQHRDIIEAEKHTPKAHSLLVHTAEAQTGHVLHTDPISGVPTLLRSGFPNYPGDPPDAQLGDSWYDTVNGRLRAKLAIGTITITGTLSP